MKITAHPLSATAATLQPSATGQGWDFLCPCAFEATWLGGPGAEDITIRLPASAPGPQDFVQSREGDGLLTFYPGYQCKTEAEHALWVRGPVHGPKDSAPKDGLVPLESVIDTAVLPGTLRIDWKFTRPGQTVRFDAGEPFCTILPYPKASLNEATVEVMPLAGTVEDIEDYERALADLAQSKTLGNVFQRLGAGTEPKAPVAALPAVTCICPARGPVERLEEAIKSFLLQDYSGPKELIVLNDDPRQTLVYDHPEVRIVNVPRRFHTIAEKLKAAVGLAAHDLVFLWSEDEISLPHRLSFTVAHLGAKAGFFKADKAWLWDGEVIDGPEPEALDGDTLHGGSCWRRGLFVKVQGYPHVEAGYARGFEALCEAEGPGTVHRQAIEPAGIYLIRRAAGTDGEEPAAGDETARRRIVLRPAWKQDYPGLVRGHLKAHGIEPPAGADEIPFPPPFHFIPPPPPLPAEQADRLFRGDYVKRISVILPATNESVLLERTVEQFAATLPADSEIIVVDNGSTDGCADFLAAGTRENVRLLRVTEPLGVAAARNRGLAEARGEIVVFSDAHMDVPERWWEPLVHTLNQPNVGVVAPGIGIMGLPVGRSSCGQRIADPSLRLQWLHWSAAEPSPVPTLGGGFMAMRHDTLKIAGGFDDGMPEWGSEDMELCVRYWLLGYEVWVVPEVTVLHYFRKARPYAAHWHLLTHNVLRVALLHFNSQRLTRVTSALRNQPRFGAALALAMDSDVWQKRADFAARRVRDDDWLFEKFKDSCNV